MDAKAEGESIGIGGWLPVRHGSGKISKALSPWFSVELDRSSAPWAYHKGEPFRAIAALEALGALLGVAAFRQHYPRCADAVILLLGVGDNRGNRYALSRLQSSRFPLCCVVMELACQLENSGARLSMRWSPRELNTEADQLSNGDTSGFSEDRRINIKMEEMQWVVLNKFMELGCAFAEESKCADKEWPRAGKRRKRLRETDPW